jgi:hypothetical protein
MTRAARILIACSLLVRGAAGQGVPLRNSQDLFVLNLGATPVGEFPFGVQALKGSLTVVDKDGQHMLRASSPSQFLITLPQALPRDFSLEFDIVPKASGNPEDLSFEGTPTINQGTASANLLWHRESVRVIGGGDTYDSAMPEDLKASTPSMLTHIIAVFEGPQVKLYTNGRRLYTLSDRKFVRGRVLRVFLGGQDDGANAVYLARLRIAAGTATVVAANPPAAPPAPSPTPTPTPPPAPTPAPAPAPTSSPAAASPSPAPAPAPASSVPGPTTLTAKARPVWGVTLRWDEIATASTYQVERSVSGQAFAALKLQETNAAYLVSYGHDDVTVLPGSSYQYRVRAVFSDGTTSAYSPSVRFDAPVQVPQISNLTATVGSTTRTYPNLPGKTYRDVTYSWTPIAGAVSYEYGFDSWLVDPATGGQQQTSSARNTVPGSVAPPNLHVVEAGLRYRFCVSVIREFDPGVPLPTAACLVTDVPSASAPAPAPSAASIAVTGFVVTPQEPWGVSLKWDAFPGAFDHPLEYSDGGSAFQAAPTYSKNQTGATTQRLLPGHHYEFRVKAVSKDGTVLSYSPTQSYDTPAQWPRVTNLAATVGDLEVPATPDECISNWCPDWGQGKSVRKVTWSWDPLPGGWTQMRGTWDRIALDPASNQTTTWRWGQSFYMVPGTSLKVETGTTVRACVGLSDPFASKGLMDPVCLDTPVPAAATALPAPGPPPPPPLALERPLVTVTPAPVPPPPPPPLERLVQKPPLTAVTGPVAVSVSQASWAGDFVEFLWKPVVGATAYSITRSNNAGEAEQPVSQGPVASYAWYMDGWGQLYDCEPNANGGRPIVWADGSTWYPENCIYFDGNVIKGTSYTYRVYAIFQNGVISPPSQPLTVVFK